MTKQEKEFYEKVKDFGKPKKQTIPPNEWRTQQPETDWTNIKKIPQWFNNTVIIAVFLCQNHKTTTKPSKKRLNTPTSHTNTITQHIPQTNIKTSRTPQRTSYRT